MQETQQCSPSSLFNWHPAHFSSPVLDDQHPVGYVPVLACSTPKWKSPSSRELHHTLCNKEVRVSAPGETWENGSTQFVPFWVFSLHFTPYWYGFCLLTELRLIHWFTLSAPGLYLCFQDVLFLYNCVFKDLFITRLQNYMCVCVCVYINSPLLNSLYHVSHHVHPSVHIHQKRTHIFTKTCRIFIVALFTTAKKWK